MFPMEFFYYLLLPAAVWFDSASKRNENQEYFLGVKMAEHRNRADCVVNSAFMAA
jgi:hypothetical protein